MCSFGYFFLFFVLVDDVSYFGESEIYGYCVFVDCIDIVDGMMLLIVLKVGVFCLEYEKLYSLCFLF